MKRKQIFKSIMSLLIISSLAMTTGCGKKTESTVASEDIKTVSVVTTENKDYSEFVKYSGFVSADELKRLSFELSGKISDVLVEEGQQVKAGDVLATLDTTTVQMAIDNANENIKLAQNQIAQIDSSIQKLNIGLDAEKLTLEKAKTGLDAEEVTLEKVKQTYDSNITKAQLQYDNIQETYNNVSQLYNSGVATKTDYDNAKLAFDTVSEELKNAKESRDKDVSLQQKKVDASRSDYELQQTSIKNMENDISAANVKKQAAQITLDQAKISLEQNTKYLTDSTLKSTIDGYVMTITLHAGEVTSAGTPVVVIKSGKEVINVGVPVEDYNRLSVGMKANIDADGVETTGEITNISLYPDESTRTYNVEITPENQTLAMGALVNVKIDLNQKNGCFIPISAIENVDGVDYVYVAEAQEDNKYKLNKKEVKLGEEEGENVLATDLSAGVKIVSKGIKNISENQTVYISE